MADEEVLRVVRYFDHANLRDVAAALDTGVGPLFRTCRRLVREGHLEKVRPMTYRVTADGVEVLDALDAEDARWNPPAGGDVETSPAADPAVDTGVVVDPGPAVSARDWSSGDGRTG